MNFNIPFKTGNYEKDVNNMYEILKIWSAELRNMKRTVKDLSETIINLQENSNE